MLASRGRSERISATSGRVDRIGGNGFTVDRWTPCPRPFVSRSEAWSTTRTRADYDKTQSSHRNAGRLSRTSWVRPSTLRYAARISWFPAWTWRKVATAYCGRGCAEIRILGKTRPCERMDETQRGFRAALDSSWGGGVYGEALDDGDIALSDEVRCEG